MAKSIFAKTVEKTGKNGKTGKNWQKLWYNKVYINIKIQKIY